MIPYIDNQEEHHRTRMCNEKLKAYLQRHGLEYNERHVLG
jgi:hypothetical protein